MSEKFQLKGGICEPFSDIPQFGRICEVSSNIPTLYAIVLQTR